MKRIELVIDELRLPNRAGLRGGRLTAELERELAKLQREAPPIRSEADATSQVKSCLNAVALNGEKP
jgi:hypothetical protein